MGITKGSFLEGGCLGLLGDFRDLRKFFFAVGTVVLLPLEGMGDNPIPIAILDGLFLSMGSLITVCKSNVSSWFLVSGNKLIWRDTET